MNHRRTLLLGLAALAIAVPAFAASELPPLNASPTAAFFPGKFVWADLFTADPESARDFYTALLGWTSERLERNGHAYYVLSNGDRPIAGIAPLSTPTAAASKGRWIGFVSVPDVSQAVAKFTADGGRTLFTARDLPRRGTQAILEDKEGALIGILHSATGDPAEYRAEPGDWVWHQLFSAHPAASSRFYHDVFTYDVVADSRRTEPGTFIFSSGGYARGSLGPLPHRAGAHPAWLSFIRVASLDDTVARVTGLGGRVLVPPRSDHPDSRMAVLADPLGSAFGIVELIDEPAGAPRP